MNINHICINEFDELFEFFPPFSNASDFTKWKIIDYYLLPVLVSCLCFIKISRTTSLSETCLFCFHDRLIYKIIIYNYLSVYNYKFSIE